MVKLLVTIFLNSVILILLVVFSYLGFKLYSAYKADDSSVANLIHPKYLLSLIHIDIEEKTKLYDSQSFTFEHPESWEPKRKDVFGDGTEVIDLKIPIFYQVSKFGGNSVIGFNKDNINKLRPQPATIISEESIVIANRKGNKWIFRENNFVYYRYAIPLQVYSFSNRQVSAFYLQAESNDLNKNLEKVMDSLAASVKFKTQDLDK